jgi:hypothetical protein
VNRPRAGLKYLFTVFQNQFGEAACTTTTPESLCAIAPPPEHKGRTEPLPFVPALRGATVRSLRTRPTQRHITTCMRNKSGSKGNVP